MGFGILNSFTSFGDEPVYFDSSKISIDKIAIKEFYRSNGFFTTSVKHSIIPDSSNNTIELHYVKLMKTKHLTTASLILLVLICYLI